MKKSGRTTKFPKEMLKEAAELYLDSELSAKEVGERYGISADVVMYHVRKMRKERDEGK